MINIFKKIFDRLREVNMGHKGCPEMIAINHDDYHAEYVGRTSDGRQFFLSNPFVAAVGDSKGAEYVALFIFDDKGNLMEAKIDDFGPRETLDYEKSFNVVINISKNWAM